MKPLKEWPPISKETKADMKRWKSEYDEAKRRGLICGKKIQEMDCSSIAKRLMEGLDLNHCGDFEPIPFEKKEKECLTQS